MNSSPPFVFVLFGATGDLAGKKILPALYKLYIERRLPTDFVIIGNSRTPRTDEAFRELVHHFLSKIQVLNNEQGWNQFAQRLFFVAGSADSDQTLDELFARIHDLQTQLIDYQNLMFHIATLPVLYPKILAAIGQRLNEAPAQGWSRVLIEKPFGTDLSSAQHLNQLARRYFGDDNIFRIDHFLGKETVQNILAFRFANGLFQPIWNAQYIDHIQVTVMEPEGLEGREIFFDATGMVRDWVQNHVLQLLALTMMESPQTLESTSVRTKRLQWLQQLRSYTPEAARQNVCYGQYVEGEQNGQSVRAYTQEEGVASISQTETYVALRLFIDNPRWQGLPIYIRTGKRLHTKVTEVSICFKDSTDILSEFKDQITPNVLTLRIQPNEGIVLRLDAKKPGYGYQLEPVTMQFCYNHSFDANERVEAYERLISEAMANNHTLFPTAEEVEAAWACVDPLLQVRTGQKMCYYPAGSSGPVEANQLIEKDGRHWIEPSPNVCNLT